ncbi:MAG: acetate--CoA ligase, partial [Nitriliruptorales bacterium]|nr:acetate--CoA ligase [Nitriliruptorales bacterium]
RKKDSGVRTANLRDYERTRREFSWEVVRAEFDGLPGGALNIAHESIDRHADSDRAGHVAIRWLPTTGDPVELTYADLAAESSRFANVLEGLGIDRGDRVFLLLGRIPELYVAALGTLKRGAVVAPLFSAFGPEPVRQRLQLGSGRVLVTTPALYHRKIVELRDSLPDLEHVLLAGDGADAFNDPSVHDLRKLLAVASTSYATAETAPDELALLHFTSGTTGTPKGAMHVHEAAVHHLASARLALDLRPEDVFWCTADPGWVTGTSYGIVAPLLVGATMIVDEAEFDAQRWYAILDEHAVTVWYTAPTAVRMLMKLGRGPLTDRDLSSLRFAASVGEPLNPEAVVWGNEVLGLPFHDNWWQTETGGIMIANFAAEAIKPGSMGRPLPGVEAAIAARATDESGVTTSFELLDEPDAEGELVLRAGWPSMFRGYLDQPERYARSFHDGWYLTGDLARRDADGYFWFVGRADDVIKSAGHLIGPFEVESALIEHPAVAEAGVIGVPDELVGNVIKAFVTLNPGHEDVPRDALLRDLKAHARRSLGPAVAPRTIEIRDQLPKTRSGKIMRRLLRARELGLPEGDLSTLEEPR